MFLFIFKEVQQNPFINGELVDGNSKVKDYKIITLDSTKSRSSNFSNEDIKAMFNKSNIGESEQNKMIEKFVSEKQKSGELTQQQATNILAAKTVEDKYNLLRATGLLDTFVKWSQARLIDEQNKKTQETAFGQKAQAMAKATGALTAEDLKKRLREEERAKQNAPAERGPEGKA